MVTGAPSTVAVAVTATTRCIAGKVTLTVTAQNNATVPVSMTVASAWGSKEFTGILPGKNASAAFSTRAAGYGAFGGTAHTALSNDGVALIVMIETLEGVTNAAAIAAVPGVDAVFVGPNDLAHSMGFDNRWNEAPVQAAIESALKAVADAGKCPGILALTPEEEARYAAWGARYVASNTAGIILKALRDVARQGR